MGRLYPTSMIPPAYFPQLIPVRGAIEVERLRLNIQEPLDHFVFRTGYFDHMLVTGSQQNIPHVFKAGGRDIDGAGSGRRAYFGEIGAGVYAGLVEDMSLATISQRFVMHHFAFRVSDMTYIAGLLKEKNIPILKWMSQQSSKSDHAAGESIYIQGMGDYLVEFAEYYS